MLRDGKREGSEHYLRFTVKYVKWCQRLPSTLDENSCLSWLSVIESQISFAQDLTVPCDIMLKLTCLFTTPNTCTLSKTH